MRNTKLFIWAVAVIVIAVDIYWASNSVAGDTISEVTLAYSWKYQTIPVAYGILTGHLFWPHHGVVRWRLPRIMVLAALMSAVIAFDVTAYVAVVPIVPMVLSIPLGHLLWPQSTHTAILSTRKQ